MTQEPAETEPWLRSLREGEPGALAALFHYFRPRLRHVVRLRMDPRLTARVDASDVLQEAYLDAARQIHSYLREPRVAFYVWLRGLACKRLLKLQRLHVGARCRTVSRQLSLSLESSAALGGELLARGSSPSQNLLKRELRQRVHSALLRLSAEDREVILMREFEDLSNREVAQVLGLTEAGATMRHGRALHRLRAKGPLTDDRRCVLHTEYCIQHSSRTSSPRSGGVGFAALDRTVFQ
jgi:RNA polymerase sigma-70 factor (ECF subfamily)